jgi:hypothetical protein
MNYNGTYCLRQWTSDVDVKEDLEDQHNPLHMAFVSVCREVEPIDVGLRDGSLATVEIKNLPNGDRLIKAVSEGREAHRTAPICKKCGTHMFLRFHLYNGCEDVIVEEIMDL